MDSTVSIEYSQMSFRKKPMKLEFSSSQMKPISPKSFMSGSILKRKNLQGWMGGRESEGFVGKTM